jgi:predicted alpha/beta-fold hydrolase
MHSSFLEMPSGKIHCLTFGSGPELLIALHGFSDRARMFAVLEPALSENYTVVAVDWPLHGQTHWTPNTFSKQDLLDIIRRILANHGKERFSLMGFSFGARLAQALLPDLSSPTQQALPAFSRWCKNQGNEYGGPYPHVGSAPALSDFAKTRLVYFALECWS